MRRLLCWLGFHGEPTIAHREEVWYDGRLAFRRCFRSCVFCDKEVVEDYQEWADWVKNKC